MSSDPAVTVIYRRDLHIMFVRWNRDATVDEIQDGYWRLLNGALDTNCTSWLLDARGRGPGGENDYWVLNVFLPKAMHIIKRQIHMAYLLKPSHYVNVMQRLPGEELKKVEEKLKIKNAYG